MVARPKEAWTGSVEPMRYTPRVAVVQRWAVFQYQILSPREVDRTYYVLTTAGLNSIRRRAELFLCCVGRQVNILEIVDHDLDDRHQRQRQRQPPNAEHDAEQDLKSE